ncbi:MAG: iron ABC transporter permease [Candidatus Onthovivens sp.]|nr:iron ABC transporter permease [Candidatus Onthovivens sp.]MDY3995033.1 iron ABC transporter permease [Candidatus Onthovivens sp.]MDY4183645.1 iron ABC transporter permease [Candidatus Onthovivens sp.]MDY4214688.1 iron ABC transporter permease [Candidatus Onthovivens sp.]MDY4822712.1 iron ABC transporter permease [Candidatus Onthovivens sp.]
MIPAIVFVLIFALLCAGFLCAIILLQKRKRKLELESIQEFSKEEKEVQCIRQKHTFSKWLNQGKTWFGMPANSILVIFGILLLFLTIAPLIYVIIDTFTVHMMEVPLIPNSKIGDFTIYHYKTLFASSKSWHLFYKPLLNSLWTSALACVFAILFGGVVAYLITRTNLKFKKLISTVFIFPYIMPQWTLALFWKNLFMSTSCTGGYAGELQALTGIVTPQWLVLGGLPIALVLGLHYAPFAYILIGGVLRNMDANLEEAATILNTPKWKIFTHITLPILKPAILSTILLVFSSAMSAYPVAVTLGKPINFTVLSTQLQIWLQGNGTQLGIGHVTSLVLIVIGILILTMNQISTGSRKQYTTVSGKSGQISKNNLGKVGKWIISFILIILVMFVCVGPMVSFALESLLPNQGDYSSGLTLQWWTSKEVLRNGYKGMFYNPEIWIALLQSILLSICCSLIAGTIGLLIGYAVSKKRKSKLAMGVNALAFLPYLLPSISMSAIFFTFSTKISFLYALPFLVCVIVGVVKYIPFASRSSLNAMLQLSNEIEEAAVIQNIPWVKRMVRIIFPIQKSSFLSGYLLPFISCMRELSLFVFIAPSGLLLTTLMFQLSETGLPALENAANLILVVVILIFNFIINKVTGASLDKGIGG